MTGLRSVDDDLDYYMRRAAQEWAAAETAAMPEAIIVHAQLARAYDARARALREHAAGVAS
ncbi:hypothetical protein F4U94_20610 [Sphingobium limneticum]|uniref:hypothetical protein n=1 Tax=Sphingobium TaxID=165695 RepID=UPI000568D966|nr:MULTISPECIES: hypothetical protein [Sphingobium]KAA9011439.1 hypothetical protein F4U94_20610 [Sphingobium limneticum]